MAWHPEAPVPARAATGRRRARARARRRPSGSTAPLRLRGDLREASRAADLSIPSLYRPEPQQHAPPFPAALAARLGPSARRQAEAPESYPVAPTAQVSQSCGLRGGAAVLPMSGLSRAAEGRPRMPERRPDGVLGHHLSEAPASGPAGGASGQRGEAFQDSSAMAGVSREGELSSSAASTEPTNQFLFFSPTLHPPTR